MEGLLAEINAKRKALTDLDGTSSEAGPSSKKYMKRSEIEAAQEAEAQRKREALRKEKEARLAAKAAAAASGSKGASGAAARLAVGNSPAPGTPGASSSTAGATPEPERETFNISSEECTRRLRSKAQPVRLFGETDRDRRLRLRALELLDERGGGPGFNDNDFRKTMADMEVQRLEREAREGGGRGTGGDKAAKAGNSAEGAITRDEAGREGESSASGSKKRVEVGVIDMDLVKTDIGKLNPLVYHYLKNALREWEEWLDARPDDVKRSGPGKLAAATQLQSAQNLKPLFKSLRARELDQNVIRLLAEMIHHMQLRSYQKANDAYLRLSIGNAAWPIGVTSVGIHGRNARDRIGEDSVAHVLNDEVSRKYIQAVKRVLTFTQTVRPPDDLSQLMG